MKSCTECFSKCKADCCTWVPHNIKFLEKHKDKVVRPILSLYPFKGNLYYAIVKIENEEEVNTSKARPVVIAQKQPCPFLTEDKKCAVYEERPAICEHFGNYEQEDHPLTCHWKLGKDYNCPALSPQERTANFEKHLKDFFDNPKLLKEYLT